MKKNSLIILMFLFATSCSFFQDEDVLGDGYYYMPYYEAKDVGAPFGSIVYTSDQKNCYNEDGILIKGGIVQIINDGHFILVGQNKKQEDDKKDKSVYYLWIVDKQTSDVYGPMSFEQYLAKKKDLGVPEKLQLKYEKERLKE